MRYGDIEGLMSGSFVVAYDSGELSSPTTSITISNLRGDVDESYEMICRFVQNGATAAACWLRLNNDTGSNYGRERLRATGSSLTANQSTGQSAIRLGGATAAGNIAFSSTLIYAKSGRIRLTVSNRASDITGTTVSIRDMSGASWNNTADEITSMTVLSNQTNGMGVGTRIILLKKVNSTAGMKTGVIEPNGVVSGGWERIYEHQLRSLLSLPDHTDWDIFNDETENWTLDMRVYLNVDKNVAFVSHHQGGNDRWNFWHNASGGGDEGIALFLRNTAGIRFSIASSSALLVGQWYHVAMIRIGNTVGLYQDGVLMETVAFAAADENAFAGSLNIGELGHSTSFYTQDGYFDEVRIYKGDPFSVSASGNYYGVFNGSNAYLTAPDHADWDILGSNSDNWTIDFWLKAVDHSGSETFVAQWENNSNFWDIKRTDAQGVRWRCVAGGSEILDLYGTAAKDISDTGWHHVACIKVGSDYGVYIDGVQVAYDSNSSTDTFAGLLKIGWAEAGTGGGYFDGGMDEVRIIKDNPFSAAPNACGVFNGTTSELTAPDHADWDIVGSNSDNWTIDAWINMDDYTKSSNGICCQPEDGGNNFWMFGHYGGSLGLTFQFYTGGAQIMRVTQNEVTTQSGVWYHVAMCKVANEYGVYINGVQVGYNSTSSTDTYAIALHVGMYTSGVFDGKIDEFRIIKSNPFSASPDSGLTDTFTFPTAPHTSDSNTKILLHMENLTTDSGNTGHTITNTNVYYGVGYFADRIAIPTEPHTSDANTKLLLHLNNNVTDSGNTVHTISNNNVTFTALDIWHGLTVPTVAHTPDANTKLLLHADDFPIVDSGTTARHATTITGAATISSADKKWGTKSLLSTTTLGNVQIPDSDDWDFVGNNTDTWTIDWWMKLTSLGTNDVAWAQIAGSDSLQFQHLATNQGFQYQCYVSASNILICSMAGNGWSDDNTTWHHWALVIKGDGSTKDVGIYVDGTQYAHTQDNSTATLAGTFYLSGATTYSMPMYMDEYRVTKGNPFSASPNSGLTDTIIVPTGAHTVGEDTKLLLHFEESPPEDSVTGHQILNTRVNVNSSIKVFGQSSLEFGGEETSSITIEDLDGDADVLYKLQCRFVNSVATGGIILRFNNDSAANYGRQFFRGNVASAIASQTTAQTEINLAHSGGTATNIVISEHLFYVKSGYRRVGIGGYQPTSVSGTALNWTDGQGFVWNNTGSNITSMVLSCLSGSQEFDSGTHIELYKLNL